MRKSKKKPRIRFFFDYGAMPLWSADSHTREMFGYNIDLKEIGLSARTIALAELASDLYWDRLNPVHHALPALWSGEMCLVYQEIVKELFTNVENEIGGEYEIVNEQEYDMTCEINVRKIEWELAQFLADPVGNFPEMGIYFGVSPDQGKAMVSSAYKRWKKQERKILLRKQRIDGNQ